MNVPPSYQMPPPSDAPNPHKSGVPGWAKWVIGCGAMVMCCCPVGGAILFPVFSQAKVAAKSTQSMNNLKTISLTWNLYSADFDDRACPLSGWNASLKTYVPDHDTDPTYDVFRDPLMPSNTDQLGYGMNSQVALKEVITFDDPSKVVILALTTMPGKDAEVTKDILRKASQGPFRTIWATADGAVTKGLIDGAQRLQWKPVLMKQ